MLDIAVITRTRGAWPRRERPSAPERCDLCGGPTIEVRCKIICKRCGYTRDCSDP
ncbi:MAG: hypothetical protein HY688_02475 [Chloroflexi bacterium]|nr:hypothetical protein [Chloroflexota bacterium]